METNEQLPTPDEARAALAQADADERATRHRPVPAWYFPVLGAVVLALFALNAVEDPPTWMRIATAITALLLAVTIGALVGIVSLAPRGYRGIRVQWGPTIATATVALAFPVAALLLAGSLGAWVWLPAGAALAIVIWVLGALAQRAQRAQGTSRRG